MKRPSMKPSLRLQCLAARAAARRLLRQLNPHLDADQFAWAFKDAAVGVLEKDRETGRTPMRELFREAHQRVFTVRSAG